VENESKKQVLVNTFSNENLEVDSRYSIVANVVIGLLIVLLICLIMLTVVYMGLLASNWTSVNFVQQTKQLVEYRASLEEIELFAQGSFNSSLNTSYNSSLNTSYNNSLITNSNSLNFVHNKTLQLTEHLKQNL
jgi:hypothetical protein